MCGKENRLAGAMDHVLSVTIVPQVTRTSTLCCFSATLFPSHVGRYRLPLKTKPAKIVGPVSFLSAEMDH